MGKFQGDGILSIDGLFWVDERRTQSIRPATDSPGRVDGVAATVREAKAAAHPLRLRILRLCGQHELTNKQLADRLGRDPGTVLYHVRQLVDAGFLESAEVRTGVSGALEKPYRSTGLSWRLSLDGTEADGSLAPIEAFSDELREAGPGAVKKMSRFALHLSPEDAEELAADRRGAGRVRRDRPATR